MGLRHVRNNRDVGVMVPLLYLLYMSMNHGNSNGFALKEKWYEMGTPESACQESHEKTELFKAELLATVSHELRSPLTSIKGYVATLLRHEQRLPREERHQFLLAINEGAARLERIVESLFQMSQLETGAIILQRSLVDVPLLAQKAMRVVEGGLSAQHAEQFAFILLLEDSDGRPTGDMPFLEADPGRLREALDILLDNAVKYSPAGGTITVVIRPITTTGWGAANEPRPMLKISVTDTGMGIAQEHIERIFERFYRADLRLTREVNGLGLGLTICKRIIELHDGAIWAESLPEKGSAFHVLLPLDIIPGPVESWAR